MLDNAKKKLLKKGVVKPSYHEEGEFISPFFVTPNLDGRYRLILNRKSLNKYIDFEHFKMHSLNEILKSVEKNCYMAALDKKDAYYSIPIEESFEKYLKFVWKGILYQREIKHDISAYTDDMYFKTTLN